MKQINPIMEKLRINPIATQKCRYFVCSDKKKIFYRMWESKGKRNSVKKIIIGIHGLAAHSEYYVLVADQLNQEGISVYALDLIHHGHSDGTIGNLEKINTIVRRMNEFITDIKNNAQNKKIKIYIMGISLGGAIAIHYAEKYPPNGLIIFSPSVKIKTQIKPLDLITFPYYLIMFLINREKPVINITKRQNMEKMTRANYRKEYNLRDPLRLKYITLDYLINVKKIISMISAQDHEFLFPTIIFQGGNDFIIDHNFVEHFFINLSCEDKQFISLKDAYHSLFSDPMMNEIGWNYLRDWFKAH